MEGSGAKVLRLDLPAGEIVTARLTNSGSSNFAIWALDGSGSKTDLLVNEIGTYKGVVLLDWDPLPEALQIESNGRWSIVFDSILHARSWSNFRQPIKGQGSDVFVAVAIPDFLVVKLSHSGDSNFAIWTHGVSGRDLIVNEIGRYQGEAVIPDDAFIIEVEADGAWSITPST